MHFVSYNLKVHEKLVVFGGMGEKKHYLSKRNSRMCCKKKIIFKKKDNHSLQLIYI